MRRTSTLHRMSDSDTESGTPVLRAAVAEEVRALLGRRRMSDIALARKLKRSHTYVYRRLSGETAFDVDDLEGIAAALNVPITELFPSRTGRVTETYAGPAVTVGSLPAAAVVGFPIPAAFGVSTKPVSPLPVQRIPPVSATRTGRTGR